MRTCVMFEFRKRNLVTSLDLERLEGLEAGEKWKLIIVNGKKDNIVETASGTSRTLPARFDAYSDRCERGPRSLLIISSNRGFEGEARSILLLSRISSTADGRPVNGHSFVHSTDVVGIKPSEAQGRSLLPPGSIDELSNRLHK